MNLSVERDLIFSILAGGCPVDDDETERFNSLKHDKDLLPVFNQKFNFIIQSCGKYGNISHEIQGMNDKGVDILITYYNDYDRSKIGIQVKSFDDMNQTEWLKTLKAQIIDASQSGCDDYYILYCTDLKQHKKKLNYALADLSNSKFPMKVHHVVPNQVLSFMNKSQVDLLTEISLGLRWDDYVKDEASESLRKLNLHGASILIYVVFEFLSYGKSQFTIEDLLYDGLDLASEYQHVSVEFFDIDDESTVNVEEFIIDEAATIDLITGMFLNTSFDSECYEFIPSTEIALLAFISDIMVKSPSMSMQNAQSFVFNFLLHERLKIANKHLCI
ncbi:hypothetical protein [Thiomicrorhabdus sp.]|uniref:hypothetical protein n=1 Tax=Thiomicrorhabdus sp. TaxID=2039724 RepID=UPI002AA71EA0|nr:hypothetical protein [Thiomicrorhabdus sp.]